jgi:predicted O-methyltransferase YrrM
VDQTTFTAVDEYLATTLLPDDEDLTRTAAAADVAGLPAISVSPLQGALLGILAGAVGARRVLEIGTLGGYSTLWLARAVPADGVVISLEVDPHHAEVATSSLTAAGVADRVEVMVGPALDALDKLHGARVEPFDLIFIDADKVNNARYLEHAVALARRNSLIVVDNVVRGGAILDGDPADPSIAGTRAAFELVARHPRLRATAIQTVGAKGYDGLLIALVD